MYKYTILNGDSHSQSEATFNTEEEAVQAASNTCTSFGPGYTYQIDWVGNIYEVPFAYEMYGRIEVEADSEEEAKKKAGEILSNMTTQQMADNASYLEDSEEIDEEGYIICHKHEEVA